MRNPAPAPTKSGIGESCTSTQNCATGLECDVAHCVCPKPAAPTNFTYTVNGHIVTFTWDAMPLADVYNFRCLHNVLGNGNYILVDDTNLTTLTFNLASGTYEAWVQSVSKTCGYTSLNDWKIIQNIVVP